MTSEKDTPQVTSATQCFIFKRAGSPDDVVTELSFEIEPGMFSGTGNTLSMKTVIDKPISSYPQRLWDDIKSVKESISPTDIFMFTLYDVGDEVEYTNLAYGSVNGTATDAEEYFKNVSDEELLRMATALNT